MIEVKAPRRYAGKVQIVTYVEPTVADRFNKLATSRDLSRARLLELMLNYALVKNQELDEERPEYPDEGKRSKVYNVRLTEGEGMRLQAEAERQEMKASAFIRLILRGAVTKTISLSVVEQDEIRKVRRELTKIGTNLNQAVKLLKANPYGENPVTVELIDALQSVVDFERQKIQEILVANIKSWANLYGERK